MLNVKLCPMLFLGMICNNVLVYEASVAIPIKLMKIARKHSSFNFLKVNIYNFSICRLSNLKFHLLSSLVSRSI